MYWIDADGTPLGLVELWRWRRAQQSRPRQICLGAPISDAQADQWWQYFYSVNTTHGLAWSPEPFAPVFEGTRVIGSTYLQATPDGWFPDLGEVGIGTTEWGGQPAIRLISHHPHLRGFQVSSGGHTWQLDAAEPVWPLPRDQVGDHTAHIAAMGWYGPLRAHPLRFTVR
jgi:hypothetical protein